jgi:hypothetical protein
MTNASNEVQYQAVKISEEFENVNFVTLANGDALEGVYEGSFTWDGRYGKCNAYKFRADDGSLKAVSGGCILDAAMKDDFRGKRMKLIYKGMGAKAHLWDIYIAK